MLLLARYNCGDGKIRTKMNLEETPGTAEADTGGKKE
jgi:hypothetical protein